MPRRYPLARLDPHLGRPHDSRSVVSEGPHRDFPSTRAKQAGLTLSWSRTKPRAHYEAPRGPSEFDEAMAALEASEPTEAQVEAFLASPEDNPTWAEMEEILANIRPEDA